MRFRPKVKSFAHQRRGVQWLWGKTELDGLGSKGGGFFWDPGTGKTKGAYDYVSASFLHRKVRKILVICPINALQVWDNQADTHLVDDLTFEVHSPTGSIAEKAAYIAALEPDPDELTILLLNYQAIIKRDQKWDIMSAIRAYAPDLLILDESHHIKGATTKQARAAHTIAGFTPYVLVLTGTPIGKNFLDLYSQLKAIDPQIWGAKWTKTGAMSWTDFRNNYATWGGRSGHELRGYINLDDFQERTTPHIRSARKEDLYDMPKVTDTIIPVEMDWRVRRAYDTLAEEGLVVWKRHLIDAPIPITKLLRLQQFTGGWVHDEQGESVAIHEHKLDILTDLLADLAAAGQSVVVYARFIAEMDAIYAASVRHYQDNRFQIRGGVTDVGRRRAVDGFNARAKGKPSLMVLQVAAAEAIDGLQTTASYGIYYSADYSLVHWNQSRGRLDRVGQRLPVTFYHLQCTRTVDSLILQALVEKRNLERMVMDRPEILISRKMI